MIELFLDGKPAVLKDNVSIKLTRENVYFTKNGSYTYDVELPLQVKENRNIFGSINRKDVETEFRELHAVLRVDNEVLLDGKAIINQVTDTSVKVQLLGGNSEMNFYAKGEEIYIDELDLGDWMNEVRIWRPDGEPREHYHGNCLGMALAEQTDMINAGNAAAQLDYWYNRWWKNESGGRTTDKGVAFPVINENADYDAESSHLDSGAMCNGYILRLIDGEYYPQFRWTWPNQTEQGTSDLFPQVIPSYQPMLIMMIRKVLEAAGYPLSDESELTLLRNSLFRHIFIVTANNRIELNKALPHWTLRDFLTQIEHFLGIVIDADELRKKTEVINRDDWWDGSATTIEDVVDEYSVEVDKEDTNDITNGNIGFADMEDGEPHIGSDILAEVVVDSTRFSNYAAMHTALRQGLITRADKAKIYEVDGHQFIVATEDGGGYYFKEVNQYRQLQRNDNKRDTDVELKIKPCPITDWECPMISTIPVPLDTSKVMDVETGTARVKVYSRPDVTHIGTDQVNTDDSELDIEALIAGEQVLSSQESGEDVMFVGVVPASLTEFRVDSKNCRFPIPVSFPNIKIDTHGVHNNNYIQQEEFLTLQNYDDGSLTLYTESLQSTSVINTTVKYCIKFISHKVLRSTGAFIINNKRYACEKLEYNITAKGVSPLVTGYFYKLD